MYKIKNISRRCIYIRKLEHGSIARSSLVVGIIIIRGVGLGNARILWFMTKNMSGRYICIRKLEHGSIARSNTLTKKKPVCTVRNNC